MPGLAEFERQGFFVQSLAGLWLHAWLLPFVCSFLFAGLLTGALIKLAAARGWVVLPRQERWSQRMVAQFGGVPILLAFTTGALLRSQKQQGLVLLFLTWGAGLVGLADDIAPLTPKTKLAGQMLLAIFAVAAGYVQPLTHLYWVNASFTIFWIVGITNAINLLDNMDGLAAGIAVIAIAHIMLFAGQGAAIQGLALCMLASLLGFLLFNTYPAKVFMGDCGALAIGFFLACTSVNTAAHLSGPGSALFVPCLVLFIPVFDTLLVSVTRRMNGKAISQGARDHTSHRLVLIGLSDRKAVIVLYIIAIGAGTSALLWKSAWADLGAGIVMLFLVAAVLFWLYLARLRLPDGWLSQAEVAPIRVPESFQKFLAAAGVIVLDGVLIVLALYFAYVVRFGKLAEETRHSFFFVSVLSIVIKLPVMVAWGTYRIRWSVRRMRESGPVLKAALSASVFFTAVLVLLPKFKNPPAPILLLDAVLTVSLLLLCRASTVIFERMLGWASLGESGPSTSEQIKVGHSTAEREKPTTSDVRARLATARKTTLTATEEKDRLPQI